MRELVVDYESSTATSLFLRDQDGFEYRLPVSEDLRSLLSLPAPADDAQPEAPAQEDSGAEDVEPVVTLSSVPQLAAVPEARELEPVSDSEPEQEAVVEAEEEAAEEQAPEPPAAPEPVAPARPARERSLPKPDPLYSNPLTMRPRDIQERIRAGASTQELADEMQVAYSRVEPYAHPVMLERERMVEIAKQSHPVREDGPAKLTLWEVLATAFGTRGHTLAHATWDSYKEPGDAWIVRVSWQAGLSENSAEWVLRNHLSSSATAEARDGVAADLTDPDFAQPVRSLSPISRGERAPVEMFDEDEDAYLDAVTSFDEDEDNVVDISEDTAAADDVAEPESGETTVEHSADADSDEDADADAQPKPTKRRRKSVTPHWEDVLLGVRSNTKRPRS